MSDQASATPQIAENLLKRSEQIGSMLALLQDIELFLRVWLVKVDKYSIVVPEFVGERIPETPLTDWRSLRKLVFAYNSRLSHDEQQYRLDERISEIRDTLAHGRIINIGKDAAHPTLFRFSNPSEGSVTVESLKELTPDVLKEEHQFLQKEFFKLYGCGVTRGYFPT